MTKIPVTSLLALGAAVATLSGCATTATEEYIASETYEENRGVAVVGSRIKKDTAADERASPSRVFDRDDMRATGAYSAGEFLGGRF